MYQYLEEEDSPVLVQEIELMEEQPLDIQQEFMGMQIKERYQLISNMVDWDHWGEPEGTTRQYCRDGHFADEHFCRTNSELGELL